MSNDFYFHMTMSLVAAPDAGRPALPGAALEGAAAAGKRFLYFQQRHFGGGEFSLRQRK
ncbi:hypothetical protein [Xaviernesmea oryzae]|uniref:hypothetical protein n=1 Tax=Xaviernesmea oryzae TaxID=464029 RepID=UPI000B0AC8C2|nr:hypothetical protein [Xaviernesmea oryzae]